MKRIIRNSSTCAIDLSAERGSLLLIGLYWISFFSIFGLILAGKVIADIQLAGYELEERKAFYAAQSGVEYGIKRFLTSDVTALEGWKETLPLDNGIGCYIEATLGPANTVIITAEGYTGRQWHTLQVRMTYVDVSGYAVYTAGTVAGSAGLPAEQIYANAPVMPVLESPVYQKLAKPLAYYSGDCMAGGGFVFSKKKQAYVGGVLELPQDLGDTGDFYCAGNVSFGGSQAIDTGPNTFYLGDSTASWTVLPADSGTHQLSGAIISEAASLDISNLEIKPDRQRVIDFLAHSLNGGPLVITELTWETAN